MNGMLALLIPTVISYKVGAVPNGMVFIPFHEICKFCNTGNVRDFISMRRGEQTEGQPHLANIVEKQELRCSRCVAVTV